MKPGDFLNWLINPDHIGYSVIAHNAGKFDAHFLINLLQDINTKEKVTNAYLVDDKPIMKGNRILSFNIKVLDDDDNKWKNITLCDSLNHIQTSLSKMPKMFQLGDFKKGYCPYTWIKPSLRNSE